MITFGAPAGQVHAGDFTATFWVRTTKVPNSSFELLGNRSCASACNFWGLRSTSSSVSFEMYEDPMGTHGAAVSIPANVSDATPPARAAKPRRRRHPSATMDVKSTAMIYLDELVASVDDQAAVVLDRELGPRGQIADGPAQ